MSKLLGKISDNGSFSLIRILNNPQDLEAILSFYPNNFHLVNCDNIPKLKFPALCSINRDSNYFTEIEIIDD